MRIEFNCVITVRFVACSAFNQRKYLRLLQVYNATCSIQAPGTYDPVHGFCEAEPISPISLGMTRDLETSHVCNKLQFNSVFSSCVESSCGYHGMCKKIPSNDE